MAQAKRILLQTAPMADAIKEGKTVTSLEVMIRIRQIETSAYRIIEELGQFSPRKVSSDQ